MQNEPGNLDPELLQSHRPFVTALARSLVRDESRADDVVQQTLLAAIEKPPEHSGNLKAWLASVTRNLALMRRRGEGRRRRREEAVARPERDSVPSPDEVHARLEAMIPSSQRVSLVHNDLKLDNCMLDPKDPDRVIAFFDWDMTTLGDPLADLGTLLNYWPDPSDPPGTTVPSR